jgi:hypothetical protein
MERTVDIIKADDMSKFSVQNVLYDIILHRLEKMYDSNGKDGTQK